MLDFLERVPRHHEMFAHSINGRTGKTIPFWRKDDGADLVETTFLLQGFICAREYFAGSTSEQRRLHDCINALLLVD